MPISAIVPQFTDVFSVVGIDATAGGKTATSGGMVAALGATDAITVPDVAGSDARLADTVGTDVVGAPLGLTRVEVATGFAVMAGRRTGKP
jgi:hypothetical protein